MLWTLFDCRPKQFMTSCESISHRQLCVTWSSVFSELGLLFLSCISSFLKSDILLWVNTRATWFHSYQVTLIPSYSLWWKLIDSTVLARWISCLLCPPPNYYPLLGSFFLSRSLSNPLNFMAASYSVFLHSAFQLLPLSKFPFSSHCRLCTIRTSVPICLL